MAGPELCRAAPAVTVRQGKGDRSRVVPAHPELMDAFRSVPRGRANDSVFHFSARTAARWLMQAAPRLALARFNVRCAIIGLIAQRTTVRKSPYQRRLPASETRKTLPGNGLP